MLAKFKNSIHYQVLLSLTIISILWIAVSLTIQSLSSQARSLSEEKAKIYRLNDAIIELKRNSQIYQLNAARDFESYFRDLEVYYKVTIQQIDAIEQNINSLNTINNLLNNIESNPINFASSQDINEMSKLIESSALLWSSFTQGLNDEFGDNKEEPRLEWGAQYIVENIDELTVNINQLLTLFEKTNQQQGSILSIASNAEITSIVGFILLFGLFFNSRVLKPIQKTKAAFSQVSNGDYGHQIEESYSNEIGELITSFNEMSSRSDTVLSILSHLQTAKSLNEATEILHHNLTSYTGCDLVTIAVEDSQKDGFRFKHLSPSSNFKNLFQLKISYNNDAEKEHIEKVALKQSSLQINNISDYINKNRNSVILNTLITRYPLKSAIVLPIQIQDSAAFLIFSSYFETKLQAKHLDLILNLMPFIKHKFLSFGTNEK